MFSSSPRINWPVLDIYMSNIFNYLRWLGLAELRSGETLLYFLRFSYSLQNCAAFFQDLRFKHFWDFHPGQNCVLRFPPRAIIRRKMIVLHGKCLSPSGVVSSIPSLFNGLKWEEAVLDANIGIPENCHLCHIQRSGSTSPEPIFFLKKKDSQNSASLFYSRLLHIFHPSLFLCASSFHCFITQTLPLREASIESN